MCTAASAPGEDWRHSTAETNSVTGALEGLGVSFGSWRQSVANCHRCLVTLIGKTTISSCLKKKVQQVLLAVAAAAGQEVHVLCISKKFAAAVKPRTPSTYSETDVLQLPLHSLSELRLC
jgi:hypothetical protein